MSVDVIIPVYRPDEKLHRLLAALKTQTMKPQRIILVHTGEVKPGEPEYNAQVVKCADEAEAVMQSRKRDGHQGAVSEPVIFMIMISPEEFDHGGSRNLGASLSTADVMVFMTQDAVPADAYLLENLVKAVSEPRCVGLEALTVKADGRAETDSLLTEKRSRQPEIAAAYARQLPYEDCKSIERYIREFNYPETSELRTKADLPRRGIKTYCNSNVCAAYSREIFDRLGGFETTTIFNEDMLFGAKAVNGGFGAKYAAEAEVYHSHNLGLVDQFHRNFDNGVSQADHPEIFGAVSSEKEGMKLVKYCISRMKEDKKLYLVPYFGLNCICRYAGFFLGKRYKKLPGGLVKALSLNKRYWS